MKKIVGIGSCLSERVARQFSMNFWGQPISMVRHNRSDQLVPIMNGTSPPELETLQAILTQFPNSDPANGDFVFGQSSVGIGRSTNESHVDLLSAMKRSDVKLVFIDNFMDLTADLWRTTEGATFFSRFPNGVGLKRLRRLHPTDAARNYETIARRSLEIWPEALVVFLHFPFSRYPEASGRQQWGRAFYDALKLDGPFSVVPPREIPSELLRNGEPHHYHHTVYKTMAEEVYGMLSDRVR